MSPGHLKRRGRVWAAEFLSYEPEIGSEAAIDITELIFEKIVLMLVATAGMSAPAEVATKPAISEYSIRSCPWSSIQILVQTLAFRR